jgi:uncharacterized protein
MESEVTMARIYLHEADHGRRKNLMQEILNVIQEQQRVKVTTVFRGIAGMGDTGEVHASDILRLLVDLPIVIEFFDEPAVVEAILKLLSGLLPSGRIVTWRASCR